MASFFHNNAEFLQLMLEKKPFYFFGKAKFYRIKEGKSQSISDRLLNPSIRIEVIEI